MQYGPSVLVAIPIQWPHNLHWMNHQAKQTRYEKISNEILHALRNLHHCCLHK